MKERTLPDSSFVVLALLAEGERHGYEIQKLVHNRGFRFWTKLERSSIYNALTLLEKERLISVHVAPGEGPDRKVYRITRRGRSMLESEALRHLENPAHPRSEIDLGIYALPFVSRDEAVMAFERCLAHLRARRAFLAERLEWCRARSLEVPEWAFERPLVALEAEIAWLERTTTRYAQAGARSTDWEQYMYREPPEAGPAPPTGRTA
jgi:DNA-binding PadR family transcriptional regulator